MSNDIVKLANCNGKTWIVGDLHGNPGILKVIMEKLKPDDRLICVGDYCDRGIDSPGVIDFILAHNEQCREAGKPPQILGIMGNHEQLFFEYTEICTSINKLKANSRLTSLKISSMIKAYLAAENNAATVQEWVIARNNFIQSLEQITDRLPLNELQINKLQNMLKNGGGWILGCPQDKIKEIESFFKQLPYILYSESEKFCIVHADLPIDYDVVNELCNLTLNEKTHAIWRRPDESKFGEYWRTIPENVEIIVGHNAIDKQRESSVTIHNVFNLDTLDHTLGQKETYIVRNQTDGYCIAISSRPYYMYSENEWDSFTEDRRNELLDQLVRQNAVILMPSNTSDEIGVYFVLSAHRGNNSSPQNYLINNMSLEDKQDLERLMAKKTPDGQLDLTLLEKDALNRIIKKTISLDPNFPEKVVNILNQCDFTLRLGGLSAIERLNVARGNEGLSALVYSKVEETKEEALPNGWPFFSTPPTEVQQQEESTDQNSQSYSPYTDSDTDLGEFSPQSLDRTLIQTVPKELIQPRDHEERIAWKRKVSPHQRTEELLRIQQAKYLETLWNARQDLSLEDKYTFAGYLLRTVYSFSTTHILSSQANSSNSELNLPSMKQAMGILLNNQNSDDGVTITESYELGKIYPDITVTIRDQVYLFEDFSLKNPSASLTL